MLKLILVATILILLLILALTTMSWTDLLERHFVFFPTREIDRNPSDVGLAFEEVYFATDDGVTLNGWFVPAPPRNTDGAPGYSGITLLWFHGNGGNIGHRVDDLALFHHLLGVNVFIFDYRGYGKSEGKPSEKGVYRDSRAALAYLLSRPDVDEERIVYLGRSLGTAVAVELALHRQPHGMVLVSPFTTIADMGRHLYPTLPVRLLAGKRYDSLSRIRQYHGPLLVIHGERDEIIPTEQGRRMYDAANPPKSFYTITGASHNDGLGNAEQDFWSAFQKFLAGLAPKDKTVDDSSS